MRRRPTLACAAALTLALAACSGGGPTATAEKLEGTQVVSDATALDALGGDAPTDPMGLLAANSAVTFFSSAPAAVLCDGSEGAVARGTELATATGSPLLCGKDPSAFAGTVDELGVATLLVVPGVDAGALAQATGASALEVPADAPAQDVAAGKIGEDAPRLSPLEKENASRVLARSDADSAPARATAQAAGATVVTASTADPRATSETVAAAKEAGESPVVALGDAWGDQETLGARLQAAATGVELPGGGQLIAADKTYVALYGTPGTGSLGLLGEQDVPATIARAQEYADLYEGLTDTTVVPTLEIIASVAIGAPGVEGTYSNVQDPEKLRPLVDAAREAGQYVVLDLQPGREHFLDQAKRYEDLLAEPHVGLALDPEWRLKPDQVHLRQVGQVQVEEVNEVADWLAAFTAERDLPQKAFVLHSFQNRMIVGLDDVDQSHDELEVVLHVDGQGGQQAKQSTWNTLHEYAPSIDSWGWKNFIDEDVPMLTPQQTMEQVEPTPVFVSYQ